MATQKMYKLITRGDLGVLKGTEVDKVDGSVKYILDIIGDFGVMEQRKVAQSTFKRWWRLVEDVTMEDKEQQEEATPEETVEEVVTEQEPQPTIEDLKKFNDAGGELTEEELEVFTKEATKIASIEQILEPINEVVEPKQPKKQRKIEGVVEFIKTLVEEKGGDFHIYSEGRKGVVKVKNKSVLFFGFRKHGAVRLFLKEQLDEALNCPYPVVEKDSYPKQYPFRLDIKKLDDTSKELLHNILNLYM